MTTPQATMFAFLAIAGLVWGWFLPLPPDRLDIIEVRTGMVIPEVLTSKALPPGTHITVTYQCGGDTMTTLFDENLRPTP